jgi:hypothetical protein
MVGFISLATTRPLAFLCKRGRRGYGGNAPSFFSFSDAASELAPPARLPEWVINARSAAECTNFTNEVCEAALAHVIESKAEAAYRRGDLFDKRRGLMEAWALYCAAPRSSKVVAFRRKT